MAELKTKVEIRQALTNLIKLNEKGQHNTRIEELWKQYDKICSVPAKITVTTVRRTKDDEMALLNFNMPKNFVLKG